MILIDYNQVILATLFVAIQGHTGIDLDENIVRHMFLNSIRANRMKFKNEFGEIVICADGKQSWRREIFPYYKSNRKKSREESDLDWNELFRIMAMIREEIAEHFPYKVLHFDYCEADDIIGTIAHDRGTVMNTGEPILILSGDKDYVQLQKYSNVKQYNPVLKKWITDSDPDKFLYEHILKGDTSDGVPNVLSQDNSFAIKERQKPLTAKRKEELFRGVEFMDELTRSRFERNKKMIDLEEVPEHYKKMILEEFDKEKTVKRSELFNFFMNKKLKNLIQDIQDF